MFCIQECGTVTDILRLEEVGEIAKLVPNCQAARSLIIRYSDTRSLISDVQSGETIMKYKNTFDNYLSSQVDLMRGYFYSKTKCPFSYKSFFTEKANILTKDMSIE